MEKKQSFFDTSHLTNDLKKRSVRGGAVTLISQFVIRVVQIGNTAVLARLLTPEDYGLIALVFTVSGFILIFQDLGLSMATIQREKISHDQINGLFWINVAFGLAMMLVFIVLAPAIEWFYGKKELFWLTIALSAGFVFSGVMVQPRALMQRQMLFGKLAYLDISALLFSVIVGIATAWIGFGVWALVFMELSKNLFLMLIIWFLLPWRPTFKIKLKGVKSMLAFGGHLTGFNIINYFARTLDHVLIGKFCGTFQLGLYDKAYRLMMLPIIQISAPLSKVAIPTLSRLQNEPEQFRRYYLRAITCITLITMPAVMFLVVMSEEIIGLILGAQWASASRIFAILGISALIQPIYNTQGWIHISVGRPERAFRWGLVGSTVIVISFFVGIIFGAIGVAFSYTIATYLILAPCLWYAGQPIGLKLGEIIGSIGRLFISSIVAGIACRFIVDAIGIDGYFVRIVVGGLLLLLVYLIVIVILYRGLSLLKDVYGLLNNIYRVKV